MNGKSALDKRGELRNQFYLELARKPGEGISEFCTRFRVMVGELKAEGVVLPSAELGWFLRTKLGLDPLREQLLETALAGKEEYEVIERDSAALQGPALGGSFVSPTGQGLDASAVLGQQLSWWCFSCFILDYLYGQFLSEVLQEYYVIKHFAVWWWISEAPFECTPSPGYGD